ncbi:MAG: hypothetical protein JO102_07775, partial [Elusimicrobia bacterium]|nr:hypothetical protein [Elusimicrobiota bacterium]
MLRRFLTASLLFLFASPLRAFSPGPAHTRVELLSESTSLSPGATVWLAIRFQMDKDWHIYWKNPGDAGMPPSVDWKLPPGLTVGPLEWPAPEKIVQTPLVSYGYLNEATLLAPVTVAPNAPTGRAVTIAAHIHWLECEKLCVPADGDVSLVRPVTGGAPEPDPQTAPAFAAARARVPLADAGWRFVARAAKDVVHLVATPPEGAPRIRDAWFFSEDRGVFDNAAPQKWRSSGDHYELDLQRTDISTGPITMVRGMLVSDAGWRGPDSERALDVQAPVQDAPASNSGGTLP